MTGIDAGASRLMGQLAQQLTGQLRTRAQSQANCEVPSAPVTGNLADRAAADPSAAAVDEQHQLLRALTQAVRRFLPDDPDRQRKAYRLFMQSVLARTLGRSRIDDMSFARLLDSVIAQMESDAELRGQLLEAGQLLLDAADAGHPAP